jgi:hypothetical protein
MRWERERVSFRLCGIPPRVPTKPAAASTVQIEKSSETRFEPVTFRLTVVRPTTLGMMVIMSQFPAGYTERLRGGRGGGGSLVVQVVLFEPMVDDSSLCMGIDHSPY